MTLNQNFAGATLMLGRRALHGADRALDALVGLIILIAELLIGMLSLNALFLFGTAATTSFPVTEAIQVGFTVALFGSIALFVITTIAYLARIARGRRSWSAPLWGLILMSGLNILGFAIMAS